MRACVGAQPVLVQISAAKTLRDTTDRAAIEAGESEVSAQRLRTVAKSFGWEPAEQDAHARDINGVTA